MTGRDFCFGAWYSVEEMKDQTIIVYTDGSSLGNPGSGGWGAVAVFPDDEVVELGGTEKKTTNNRMELTAAIRALSYIRERCGEAVNVIVYTDSRYVVEGITRWVFGWMKNGWSKKDGTPVLNKDLWEELVSLGEVLTVSWRHVSGHSGLPGNERADKIATAFAEGKDVKLYRGPLADYGIDVHDVSYNKQRKEKRDEGRSRSSKKAYSYLSVVDGKLEKHKTWDECKKRVQGVSDAKFRKTISQEDEAAIVRAWHKEGVVRDE